MRDRLDQRTHPRHRGDDRSGGVFGTCMLDGSQGADRLRRLLDVPVDPHQRTTKTHGSRRKLLKKRSRTKKPDTKSRRKRKTSKKSRKERKGSRKNRKKDKKKKSSKHKIKEKEKPQKSKKSDRKHYDEEDDRKAKKKKSNCHLLRFRCLHMVVQHHRFLPSCAQIAVFKV